VFLFKERLVEVELLLSYDRVAVKRDGVLLSGLKAAGISKARQFSHVNGQVSEKYHELPINLIILISGTFC